MSKDNDVLYQCDLNPDVQVMVVFPESDRYEAVQPYFKEYGHAFTMIEQKTVVIDGKVVNEPWFTQDHLDVIEAHEVGHMVMNESGDHEDDEKRADWLGYHMLLEHGKDSAAEFHRQEYHARYGAYPEDEKTWEVKML